MNELLELGTVIVGTGIAFKIVMDRLFSAFDSKSMSGKE